MLWSGVTYIRVCACVRVSDLKIMCSFKKNKIKRASFQTHLNHDSFTYVQVTCSQALTEKKTWRGFVASGNTSRLKPRGFQKLNIH